MNIKNNVSWQGNGWYVIESKSMTERTIAPHSTDFHKGSDDWWRRPVEGESYQYLERKPGPHESMIYWQTARIVAAPQTTQDAL